MKARESIGAAIATCRHGDSLSAHSEHVVRINGVESGLMHLDLSSVFRSCDSHMVSPDAIMLPKVDSVDHIQEVRLVLLGHLTNQDTILERFHCTYYPFSTQLDLCLSYHRGPSPLPLPLYIIMESPAGLQNLPAICHHASQQATHLRLCGVVFGSDDFLARLGIHYCQGFTAPLKILEPPDGPLGELLLAVSVPNVFLTPEIRTPH